MLKFNSIVHWRILVLGFLALLFLLGLAACAPAAAPLTAETPAPASAATVAPPTATAAAPPNTATSVPATATVHALTVQEAAALITPETPEAAFYPFADPGPYAVGWREYEFVDPSRDGRVVSIGVWYPADSPAESDNFLEIPDAAPDMAAAPYPLLLSSSRTAGTFARHMASHGFVMAGLRGQDSSSQWGKWVIDYPLDILFALNQIATTPLDGLDGVIDADHAGAMGFSFDGYNALALSGARADPESYLARCADPASGGTAPEDWWVEYICTPAGDWDKFAAHAGEAITTSDDGLWQPMTDERIRAVMPMAPEGAWFFGERGLAAVNRPTLIIGATEDVLNYYDLEAFPIYEQLGTPDRFLITFIGEGHMMIFNREQIDQLQHLATAFFGTYLQGRSEMESYFSEEFVAQHDELGWGAYERE